MTTISSTDDITGVTRRTTVAASAQPARPKLRDVAAAAGVSVMTVSNVVNGRNATMTEQTRLRIEGEIKRLDYRPQRHARSLRRAEHRSIGMMIVDTSPSFLADPFTTQIVSGLSNSASSHDYSVMLQGIHPALLTKSAMVRNVQTDAMCALLSGPPRVRQRAIEILSELKQPTVLFQEALQRPLHDVCVLRQNDYAGGRMLGEAVIAQGARQLLLLMPRLFWPAIHERVRGIRAAARAASAPVTVRMVRAEERDLAAIQSVLRAEFATCGAPDALLAGNDQMALGAAQVVRLAGLEIPRDIMITGFNGFEFWGFSDPALTTVKSSAYELGVRAGLELIRRLETGGFDNAEIVLPVQLEPGATVNWPATAGSRPRDKAKETTP